MDRIDPDGVRNLLEQVRGRRVVLLGDLILDTYIWGGVTRISPEAPVPVVRQERESHRLGGAGNVARNLAVLGASVEMAGIVGDDEAGATIVELLELEGIDTSCVHKDETRPTTSKTRVIAQNQQVVRVDRESNLEMPSSLTEELSAQLRDRIDGRDAVLVEDYDKGLIDEAIMETVRECVTASKVPLFVDPKGRDANLYRGARCLTPNRAEVSFMTGHRVDADAELDEAARKILALTEAEGILVTKGEEGMVLYLASGSRAEVPALRREVFDVTGAGDTVVAVLALVGAGEASLLDAARVAACAAGVTVEHLGTVAPTVDEIVAAARQGRPAE